ncbi:MAG: DUF6364 family protein [Firmicutes bacterium]|nr:DUF6364 family protein [Bacillota bacterium]
MTTKLTLSMDEKVIKKAKEYAAKKKKSLSQLIEDFLKALTANGDGNQHPYPPLTAGLAGIIKDEGIGDLREEYTRYLQDKYQ